MLKFCHNSAVDSFTAEFGSLELLEDGHVQNIIRLDRYVKAAVNKAHFLLYPRVEFSGDKVDF